MFVPIAFMGGIVGQFFRQFGLTVAIATLFSLLRLLHPDPDAQFPLVPEGSIRCRVRTARPSPGGGSSPSSSRPSTGAMPPSGSCYRRVLDWALDHRLVTVLIGIVTLVACVAIAVPENAAEGRALQS